MLFLILEGSLAKVSVVCEMCGTDYLVPQYRAEKTRFCGKICRSSWVAQNFLNKGPKPWAAKNLDGHRHKSTSRFAKGHEPWNKDLKGIHLSPESEFKAGRVGEKHLPVGAITVRTHRGVDRRFIKTSEPNVWVPYARYVWEKEFGEIPDSWVVHHKDRDTLNDEIGNLQAMSREDHAREHYGELREAMSRVDEASRQPDMFVSAPVAAAKQEELF